MVAEANQQWQSNVKVPLRDKDPCNRRNFMSAKVKALNLRLSNIIHVKPL